MTARSARRLLCGKYRCEIFPSDVVDWAYQELAEDRDSESLRRLAALAKTTNWWAVEPLLLQTFADLGYAWLDEESCYWECARDIASDIVEEQTPLSEGISAMYKMRVALSFPKELIAWEFLSGGCEFTTYGELWPYELWEAVLSEAATFLDSRKSAG
jgi:hypothetical protein